MDRSSKKPTKLLLVLMALGCAVAALAQDPAVTPRPIDPNVPPVPPGTQPPSPFITTDPALVNPNVPPGYEGELSPNGFVPGDPLDPATHGFGANFPVDPKFYVAVVAFDARLNADMPWDVTPDGRVLPNWRDPIPPTPIIRRRLDQAFSISEGDEAIELLLGEQPALGDTLGVRISRLAVEPSVVEIEVGQSIAIDRFVVSAYSTTGEFVERAPIRLEFEGPEGFVDLEAFAEDGKTLTTLTRGIGRIWVTSLLPALLTEPFAIPVVLIAREPGQTPTRLSTRVYENTDPN